MERVSRGSRCFLGTPNVPPVNFVQQEITSAARPKRSPAVVNSPKPPRAIFMATALAPKRTARDAAEKTALQNGGNLWAKPGGAEFRFDDNRIVQLRGNMLDLINIRGGVNAGTRNSAFLGDIVQAVFCQKSGDRRMIWKDKVVII